MARPAVAIGAVLAVVAVGVGGYVAWHEGVGPLPDPEGCTATAGGHTASLSIEQAENASIIAAVAERRGLPAHAVSIAIATAIQESKLQNLEGGDRDSIGIFQQRPSQGWGSPRQLSDPYYAANAFYDALVQVDGYEDMPLTEAAQAVQRSAFPDAYAEHEADGRAVASALSGYSSAAFSCVVHGDDPSRETLGANGLTGRADAVRSDLDKAFGPLPMGGFAPGGVATGHEAGSAHYDGRAIDVFFRPVDADSRVHGWAVAQYLVANARRLDIEHVIFDGRIWSAGSRSEDGWRRYVVPKDAVGDRAVLEHRDHVHVDVY
jgi:hypothetical protein